MEAHWRKIGFRPDTEANNEVDDLPELDVQFGHTRTDPPVVSASKLQSKYKSLGLFARNSFG